jgi:4'-phosphopantetheinyl transferase
MTSSRIFCEQIEPVWQNGVIIPTENYVDIWKICVKDYQQIPQNILNKDEVLKASRFLHDKDRASFLVRRTALRILLNRYTDIPASKIEFIVGKNKKPELRSDSNKIRFNVSHSGELILIAISDTEIGVDIERIESGLNYSDILKHAFNEQEINRIEEATDSREVFFKLWTRKEALCKASSKGLDDELKEIPCLDGWHQINEELIGLKGNWQLKSFNVNNEYIGSIACQTELNLNYLTFEF